MRLTLKIIIIIFFASCSNKYSGLHTDLKKFKKDVKYCLKKSCKNKKDISYNLSIISSALAYGGGGGGGGGGGISLLKEKISYKTFYLCLQEKGYTKDEDGMFEISNLACD